MQSLSNSRHVLENSTIYHCGANIIEYNLPFYFQLLLIKKTFIVVLL